MKLFVGLGNPGGGYAKHRHNVGFMAADRIAEAHGFGAWKGKFSGQLAEGRLGGEKCLLLKPQTYMNESGRSVGEAMRFYKLTPGAVTVFYDELDLAPGKVKVKTGGGAAGHNGIKSTASHVGPDFTRVRIGIGHPGSKAKVTGHVLHDFTKADRDWLEPLLDAIANAAPKLAAGDAAGFMNDVALKTQGEKTAAKPERKKPAAARPRPSQRDLARQAAERQASRDAPEERDSEPEVSGPFARLRNLFGGGRR